VISNEPEQLSEAAVRRRAEQLYEQLDALMKIHRQARRELLTESKKHAAQQLLRQIPLLGPIPVALLIALLQTPHRFRTKRQLWAYSGLALRTRTSGEYRLMEGQLQPSKRLASPRGLNHNHSHDLKSDRPPLAATARSLSADLSTFGPVPVAVHHILSATGRRSDRRSRLPCTPAVQFCPGSLQSVATSL